MLRSVEFKHSRARLLALFGVFAAAAMFATAAVHAQDHDRGRPERRFDREPGRSDRGPGRFDRGPGRFDRGPGHFDPARQHFDRFNHAHFYPNRGTFVRVLPDRHYDVVFRGGHYFFAAGVWYAPGPGGWVVVAPPIGLFAPVLPPYYTTVWVAGAPYYYADDVYYVYRGPAVGYEVVAPPPGEEVAAAEPQPSPPSGPGSGQPFIYPRNGQTQDQQARDQYECHTWATSQTHFDPMAPNGGVPPPQTASARADYNRAMAACLEGRGYTVK